LDGSKNGIKKDGFVEKIWKWPHATPDEISVELQDFSPLEQQLLYKREVKSASEAKAFLSRSVDYDLDPAQLFGMKEAVQRIQTAINSDEKIVIYGDYDADGVTATALLTKVLERLDGRVEIHIPNRFRDGYGLKKSVIKDLREQGASLIITVDCGIRAIQVATFAKEIGLDLIVTDHHDPGEVLPEAFAVINPKQKGDPYPFKGLAGVGVAYKLAQSLLIEEGYQDYEDLLDLVAIGTVADLAPLRDENRYMVQKGLRKLSENRSIGLKALREIAKTQETLSANDIAFRLGPRINAAGRVESAENAFRLLMAMDAAEAYRLADFLERQNKQRRKLTEEIIQAVKSRGVIDEVDPYLYLDASPDYHLGVIGLAASRLCDEYYRPFLLGTKRGEYIRGSARSISEFHITNALSQCDDILVRYGGHAGAAGFKVKVSNFEALKERLQNIAEEQLRGVPLNPSISIDTEVNFDQLDETLLSFIERMEPFGQKNLPPILASREVKVYQCRQVGARRNHMKLTLGKKGHRFDAIAFRQGHLAEKMTPQVDVAFYFERNVFRGVESKQLNVVDIKPAERSE
jgi:single-stranded-DNA-specific exonuclease